jgi:hypothetical protein
MAILMTTGLLVALAGAAGAAAKPTTVWTDGKGDVNVPGADALGMDLVSGSIVADKTNIDFTVADASSLPGIGAAPEAFRFLWAFDVDGTSYRLTIKSVDIGKPDVAGGTGNERVGQVYPTGEFRLEGKCTTTSAGINFVNCQPLAYVKGAIDTSKNTFTAFVPMKLIGAHKGSVITGGAGDAATICQVCWITHIAERSLNTTIVDDTGITGVYKVP